MAIFECKGMDELAREIQREGSAAAGRARAVLKAGAEEVRKHWAGEAEARAFRRTGGLIASFGPLAPPVMKNGRLTIEVGAVGKRADGTRYGAIAAYLHNGVPYKMYGKRYRMRKDKKFRGTPGIPKTQWKTKADAASSMDVLEAMRAEWGRDRP
jgi:hypothetical protein